ncbi:MAG TPA: hypothetical protein VJI98_02130 [Candidatus Nanoarchaeia archaeon]|nr:hypothetical protein [Candidatus Nanoarchaeia archaeon]
MSLQLGPELAKAFDGAVTETMPVLISGMRDGQQIDIPRELMPIDYLYDQRVNGLEPFRTRMRENYFSTAAAVVIDKEGNQKFDLRSPLLRDHEIINQNNLSQGAARISDERYEAVCGDGVKELTKTQIAALNGNGYVRKKGSDLFVPVNDDVEEFHEFLNQGIINLQEYAGTVAEETSSKCKKTDRVMNLYFNKKNHGSAVVGSLAVSSTDYNSSIDGDSDLGSNYARLGGVVPEVLYAFDNRGRKSPTSRELAQLVWNHMESVDIRTGFTIKDLEEALRFRC